MENMIELRIPAPCAIGLHSFSAHELSTHAASSRWPAKINGSLKRLVEETGMHAKVVLHSHVRFDDDAIVFTLSCAETNMSPVAMNALRAWLVADMRLGARPTAMKRAEDILQGDLAQPGTDKPADPSNQLTPPGSADVSNSPWVPRQSPPVHAGGTPQAEGVHVHGSVVQSGEDLGPGDCIENHLSRVVEMTSGLENMVLSPPAFELQASATEGDICEHVDQCQDVLLVKLLRNKRSPHVLVLDHKADIVPRSNLSSVLSPLAAHTGGLWILTDYKLEVTRSD